MTYFLDDIFFCFARYSTTWGFVAELDDLRPTATLRRRRLRWYVLEYRMRRVSSHQSARAPTAVRSDPRCPALIQQGEIVSALRLPYYVFYLLGRGVLARRLRIAALQLHTYTAPHVQRVGIPLLHS